MVKLIWTEEADIWIRDIFEYIHTENPDVAEKIVNDIYARTQDLIQYPKLGHIYENITDEEIRILLYGHYRIAYRIVSDDQIDVLGVFHGRVNIDRYLLD